LKGFFYEPLFAPAAVSRELNAVDSEFRSNLLKDFQQKEINEPWIQIFSKKKFTM